MMVYEVEEMYKGDTPHKRGVSGDPPPIAFGLVALRALALLASLASSRAISLRFLTGALVCKLKKRGDGTVTWVPWGP